MLLEKQFSFSEDEAISRLTALTEYWRVKYGVQSSWSGSSGKISGKVKGVKFDGTISVEAGRMKADVKAGFLAEKIGGRQYVDRKLDDYLHPSNSVADLEARAR